MEEESKSLDVCSSLSLIDFSSEDDFLLIPPSSNGMPNQQSPVLLESCNVHGGHGGFEGESAQKQHSTSNSSKEVEDASTLLEPSDPSRTRRPGKCNLRKSLAWDSAFFTSEGILDPDELEVVSKPFKKAPAHALPGIQEDIRKSSESTTTLGSDASALESLEVELFEDIRASIQKSGHEYRNASDPSLSRINRGQRESDISCSGASQVEHTSRNRTKSVSKPLSADKRYGLNKQQPERNSKEVLVRPRVGVATSGDHHSSLKPPKILLRVNPSSTAPTKKTLPSSGSIRMKNNVSKASVGCGSNQKSADPCKKPVSGAKPSGPASSLPSPTSSSSSGSSRSTKTLPTTPSSHRKTGNTKTLRNEDSRNANLSSNDSVIKTPRRSSRSKTEIRNPRLSAYLMSTSMISPSRSPASSIDGLSSESSSSTCTASQMSHCSKASLDISSTSSFGGDFSVRDAPEPPDQSNVGHEGSIPSQGIEKASSETDVLYRPAAASAPRSCTNSLQHFKPSGLRMPSPKIGFFDAEKTGVRTSNVGLQFHSGLRSNLLKNASGINNLDAAIKQRPSKLQYARPLTQTGTLKFHSNHIGPTNQSSASSMKPASSLQPQQLLNPSRELACNSKTKNHPSTAVVVMDSSCNISRGGNFSTRKLQAGAADKEIFCQDADLNMEEHDDRDVIKKYEGTFIEKHHLLEIEPSFVKLPECHNHIEASNDFDLGKMDESKSLSNSGKNFQDQVDFLQGSSESSSQSFSPTKMEQKPSSRSPSILNCSFGNRNVLVESNMEVAVDKMTMFPLLDGGSQVTCLDSAVEFAKENLNIKSWKEEEIFMTQKENISESNCNPSLVAQQLISPH